MITPPTNHDSSPHNSQHNSPPGFNGSMNNRAEIIPRNLFNDLRLENRTDNKLDRMSKTYYFIAMYFSKEVSIPNDEISGLAFLIESFPRSNFSIEQYYVICNIINRLLISPSYGNIVNKIEDKMENNNLDDSTKNILNILENRFDDFLPILLPEIFLNLYNNQKKKFDVWGPSTVFNIHSINNIEGQNNSKNLFNSIPYDVLSTL